MTYEERTRELQGKLEKHTKTRSRYTKALMICSEEETAGYVEMLNVTYEILFYLKKQLGHLKNKRRKLSLTQALKFRTLYQDVA